jgi:hypothetical protein
MTPQQRLDAIITERTLRAFPPFGANFPCACFSEASPEHLAFLVRMMLVKPWGIVTRRASLLRLGGGAVAYVPDTPYQYFKNVGMAHWAVRVATNSTWMHEREWRVPRQSGEIRLNSVSAILIGDASWRPSLVETDEETPHAQPRQDYPALWRESEIWAWDDESKSVIKHRPGSLC